MRRPDGSHGAVTTPSGKVELIRAHLTDDIPRLQGRLDRANPALVLTSRRHLRSNDSRLHNVQALMRGRDRCTLLIHPLDAAHAGVTSGEFVQVSTSEGAVTVAAEVIDEVMPGVVCLPHGWGHGLAGTQLSTANRHPGVNSICSIPPTRSMCPVTPMSSTECPVRCVAARRCLAKAESSVAAPQKLTPRGHPSTPGANGVNLRRGVRAAGAPRP